MIDINELLKMFKNNDYEQRIEAISIAYDYIYDIRVKSSILICLNDEDPLVKISAIEAVGDCKLTIADSELKLLLKDENLLIRCAILITIGLLNKTRFVDDMINISNISEGIEFVSSCYGLYLLGEDRYLFKALNCLNDEDYLVRCHVVNQAYSLKKKKM